MSLDRFLADMAADFGPRVRRQEPLSRHTTLRLGGSAEVWLAVKTVAELVAAVTLARRHKVPIFVLGSGANLLISDAGISGLVVANRADGVEISPTSSDQDKEVVRLTAQSGVIMPNLARRCARRGLSGLEWAIGVPGTVGGGVVNNAGAYGQEMASNLVRAELLSPANERVWQPVTWFDYGYRRSRLKEVAASGGEPESRQWIVLQADLQLETAPVAEIKARMDRYNQRRKATQPPGATIGSMFKNPPGDYAGRLIEAAGLKGYRIGQAQISPVHANFFQNLGDATTADMLSLIDLARKTVDDKFGVALALEIEVVGEF